MERRMGFSKNDVYYIGDNFDNDIIGANAAGWKTIWVNFRKHKAVDQEVSATYVVETPEELLRLVEELTRGL
jgi:putative hydrolase of the HAD superfamily